MTKSLHTTNVGYINNNLTLTKSELSLETDGELPKISDSIAGTRQRYSSNIAKLQSAQNDNAYYRKIYIAWDNIERANKPQNCTDKKQVLSKNSQAILAVIIQKLRNKDKVFLNHKYISTITRCKRRQNQNIIKELSDILEINYHNSVSDSNGQKYRHCYSFSSKKLEQNNASNSIDFDSSNGQKIARQTSPHSIYIKNKIINNRSSVQKHESNFDNDLILEENGRQNEIVSSEETPKTSIHVLKAKKPSNKRKKRTKAEIKARKAKVWVFKQYNEKKDLAAHYPLTPEDCSKLQVLSGRDFTLNAMNEILLDMSKRVGRLFCSKAQFMAYMAKVYEHEKRDAVKVSGNNFKIKANETEESKQLAIYEKFLSKIEQQAIDHVCPENQLKAKLAGTLPLKTAYSLLLKAKCFNLVGKVAKVHLSSPTGLREVEKGIILSQVRAVYGDVDDLEFIIERAGEFCSDVSDVQKPEPAALKLPEGVWGEISQKLIDKYGVDIYKSWFAKLQANFCIDSNTLELSSNSSFILDWVSRNYGIFMQRVVCSVGVSLKFTDNLI